MSVHLSFFLGFLSPSEIYILRTYVGIYNTHHNGYYTVEMYVAKNLNLSFMFLFSGRTQQSNSKCHWMKHLYFATRQHLQTNLIYAQNLKCAYVRTDIPISASFIASICGRPGLLGLESCFNACFVRTSIYVRYVLVRTGSCIILVNAQRLILLPVACWNHFRNLIVAEVHSSLDRQFY